MHTNVYIIKFIKDRPSHGKEGTLPKLGINYLSVQACVYIHVQLQVDLC